MAVQAQKGQEIKLKSSGRASSLVGVLLILLTVAGYTFFTGPLASDLEANTAALTSKEAEIVNLGARLDTLSQAETDLELSTEVQRQEVERKIPVGMNQDEVIEDLVNVAQDFAIGLRSLSFGRGSSALEGVASLRINASFEGDFSDLTDFLQGIEQNARFIRVNSISVQISKLDISNITRATFSLSMEAFFRSDLT